MLRKKLESESGTEIADSGFLIMYEKPVDSGSRIRISINGVFLKKNWARITFFFAVLL